MTANAAPRARRSHFGPVLPPAYYDRDTEQVARDLLGAILVCESPAGRTAGRIVETEAYLGVNDLASHSRGGRMTKRNQIMFAGAGQVYMFLIYGLHHCFNITANREGHHEAVLIRAGEAVDGIERMIGNRGLTAKSAANLANGPGKLCQALQLDMSQSGLDLTDESNQGVYIASDGYKVRPADIQSDARIGVGYAGKDRDRPWRYYLKTSPSVSLTKEQHQRRRTRQTNATTEEVDKK